MSEDDDARPSPHRGHRGVAHHEEDPSKWTTGGRLDARKRHPRPARLGAWHLAAPELAAHVRVQGLPSASREATSWVVQEEGREAASALPHRRALPRGDAGQMSEERGCVRALPRHCALAVLAVVRDGVGRELHENGDAPPQRRGDQGLADLGRAVVVAGCDQAEFVTHLELEKRPGAHGLRKGRATRALKSLEETVPHVCPARAPAQRRRRRGNVQGGLQLLPRAGVMTVRVRALSEERVRAHGRLRRAADQLRPQIEAQGRDVEHGNVPAEEEQLATDGWLGHGIGYAGVEVEGHDHVVAPAHLEEPRDVGKRGRSRTTNAKVLGKVQRVTAYARRAVQHRALLGVRVEVRAQVVVQELLDAISPNLQGDPAS